MSRLAVAVTLLVLALAGSAVAALTPSQYRTKATAICKATSAKLEALPTAKTKKDFAPLIKKALPIFRAQYGRLKALSPPASLRPLHVKMLGLEKQQLDGIEKFLDQVDGGVNVEKAYNAMDARLGKVSDAETATWKKLQIPTCARL